MNKLASLAMIVLLSLGGLMWYAANGSMSEYLQHAEQQITQQLPSGSQFSIDQFHVTKANSQGEVTHIYLSVPLSDKEVNNGEDNESEVGNDDIDNNANTQKISKIVISIPSIQWQFEARSLKKSVVNVEQISLPEVSITLPSSLNTNAIAQLTATITQLIANASSNESDDQLGLFGRHEFLVKAQQLYIEQLYITLTDGDNPVEEIIAGQISLTPKHLSNDNRMTITAAYIFEAILNAADQELAKHIN
ncbi:hypothetical protein [Colwellia sp. MEBiC06753]